LAPAPASQHWWKEKISKRFMKIGERESKSKEMYRRPRRQRKEGPRKDGQNKKISSKNRKTGSFWLEVKKH
jgi:RNA processing factor Prp31